VPVFPCAAESGPDPSYKSLIHAYSPSRCPTESNPELFSRAEFLSIGRSVELSSEFFPGFLQKQVYLTLASERKPQIHRPTEGSEFEWVKRCGNHRSWSLPMATIRVGGRQAGRTHNRSAVVQIPIKVGHMNAGVAHAEGRLEGHATLTTHARLYCYYNHPPN
jgi:hypothetical protein